MLPAGVSFIGVTWSNSPKKKKKKCDGSKVHNLSLSDVKIHLRVNRQNFEKSIHNFLRRFFFFFFNNLNDVSCYLNWECCSFLLHS